MARFRAYATDSEEDSDSPVVPSKSWVPLQRRRHEESDDDDDVSSHSGSSSLHESELENTPSRKKKTVQLKKPRSSNDASRRTTRRPPSSSPPPARQHTLLSDPTLTQWAQKVGVDPQRMHVMQTTLFHMPEEAAALVALSQSSTTRPKVTTAKSAKTMGRKHSRDSEGDSLRPDAQERASFAHPIVSLPTRPTRKFARTSTSESAVIGTESLQADAGLALGRSFRVGWGPGGTLVHLGTLCSPFTSPKKSANSSTVLVTALPLTSSSTSSLLSNLLQHHLTNTPIRPDASGIPFASPTPASKITFASFLPLLSSRSGGFEKSLFKLGHALFDDQDLRLGESVTLDVRNRIYSLRRKVALSKWLEDAVSSSVDRELRERPSLDDASKAFVYMTGNQIDKACEVAMDGGYTKLATLIAQAGGDEEFRADVLRQLEIWQEEKVDVHIEEGVRKVYSLLGGFVEGSGGGGENALDIAEGLDWKRLFGLHLWFGEPGEAGIADVFQAYTDSFQDPESGMAEPVPWYLENASGTPNPPSRWLLRKTSDPPDALYSLVRLFSDPTCSLSQVLSPLSFSSSPTDYALCWHLYVILSRCMKVRDFSDRGRPEESSVRRNGGDGEDEGSVDEEGEIVEGHSPSADLLASMYAHQLERLGMVQEAVFVLLHIEGGVGREKAIKDLLSRCAPKLDEWTTRGLLGSLRLPMEWVNQAKALYAISTGNVYTAYELYLSAGLHQSAHDIAVRELAPEAIVRGDLELVKRLLEGMDGKVEWWNVRGKVFLDYANVLTRLPELYGQLQADANAVPDAAQALELEELTRQVPKLIGLLPDVLHDRSEPRHKAALTQMVGALVGLLGRVKLAGLSQANIQLKVGDEGTRLRYTHANAYEKFLSNVQLASASA